MNRANAVGFLFCGIAMWMSPVVLPALFRHMAIDGVSTRALWTQLMGLVHCIIGSGYLLRQWLVMALERARNLADLHEGVVTGDWQPDAVPSNLVLVDISAREVAHNARLLAMHSLSAAEARITNLVGRTADVRQAA
jgi:hypothetical protein